jgi:hypothetical protein
MFQILVETSQTYLWKWLFCGFREWDAHQAARVAQEIFYKIQWDIFCEMHP